MPLLRQALADPSARIAFRAIDRSWVYQKVFSLSVTGFNPFERDLYVARVSAFADWIRGGKKNDRRYNAGDALVDEALFIVHDYLHIWARAVIQHEFPELAFGYGPITRASLEAFAFCHLATEAVATVGLDYWYLSTLDLDDVCELGTCARNLVCAYREEDLREYRRFNPTYEVQRPQFLVELAEFYATGEFVGFSAADVLASPKLLRWTEHELTYAQKQRSHIRSWLAYLSNGAVDLAPEELSAPLAIERAWQHTLLRRLADLLWRKVKHDDPVYVQSPRRRGKSWARKRQGGSDVPDFRFTNLNVCPRFVPKGRFIRAMGDLEYKVFCAQWLSAHELGTVPHALRKALPSLVAERDFSRLNSLFRKHDVRRVPGARTVEPIDLFMLP